MPTTAKFMRHRYLDGVRGLASLQVLVSHALLAFHPAALGVAGFLADGDFAVLLFFVMSGFVLTESFERQQAALPLVVLTRFLRLGLPVAAACLVGYLLVLSMPDAHLQAGTLSGSKFLLHKSIASPSRAAADIFCITMFTGTSNTTLFSWLAPWLPGTESSLDPPTWSMHIEFWGSMLVLALVLASRRRPLVFGIALLLAAALVGFNALVLFICGFLLSHLARWPRVERWVEYRATWVAGAVLIVLGILLAGHSFGPRLVAAIDALSSVSMFRPYDWYHLPKTVAALMVFVGILALPPLQRWLSIRPVAWLGGLSYAIYLLHIPVLLTIGSLVFVALHGYGEVGATATTLLVVAAITVVFAVLFERMVDRPTVEFARRLRTPATRSART